MMNPSDKIDIDDKRVESSCLEISQEFNVIIQPLIQLLKIPGASFTRLYNSRERIWMSNSPLWIKNYFQKNYFTIHNYNSYLHHPPYTLWSNWAQSNQQIISLLKDAYDFGYGNALSVVRSHNSFIDVFCFRADINDHEANERFIANFDIIDRFIEYFLLQAKNVILKAERYKITYAHEEEKVNWAEQRINEALLIQEYPYFNQRLLSSTTGEPFLSLREEECLKYFVKGKTAKEIARILGISPRTVEVYLLHLKLKTNSTCKGQLIDKIFSNEYNRGLLLK